MFQHLNYVRKEDTFKLYYDLKGLFLQKVRESRFHIAVNFFSCSKLIVSKSYIYN